MVGTLEKQVLDSRIDELIARIESRIEAQLEEILRDPAFAQMVRMWASAWILVSASPHGGARVAMLDVHPLLDETAISPLVHAWTNELPGYHVAVLLDETEKSLENIRFALATVPPRRTVLLFDIKPEALGFVSNRPAQIGARGNAYERLGTLQKSETGQLCCVCCFRGSARTEAGFFPVAGAALVARRLLLSHAENGTPLWFSEVHDELEVKFALHVDASTCDQLRSSGINAIVEECFREEPVSAYVIPYLHAGLAHSVFAAIQRGRACLLHSVLALQLMESAVQSVGPPSVASATSNAAAAALTDAMVAIALRNRPLLAEVRLLCVRWNTAVREGAFELMLVSSQWPTVGRLTSLYFERGDWNVFET